MRDRKWKLAVATWILCAVIAAGAFTRWLVDPTSAGAVTMVMQGLGGIAGVLGLYGAVNVAQKGVVGKHYRPELDKGGGG